MDNILKLKTGGELKIKFTPRTVARFQRSTSLTLGDLIGLLNDLSPYLKSNLTSDEVVAALKIVGYEDLARFIYAGCLELESVEAAENLLDDLELDFFRALGVVLSGFNLFISGDMIPQRPKVEAEAEPDPTKPKPKEPKPKPEAATKAG